MIIILDVEKFTQFTPDVTHNKTKAIELKFQKCLWICQATGFCTAIVLWLPKTHGDDIQLQSILSIVGYVQYRFGQMVGSLVATGTWDLFSLLLYKGFIYFC